MNIKIAICDDENHQLQYIKTLITKWTSINKLQYTLDMYESAEQFKNAISENNWLDENVKSYDILLLDIQMGGQDGIALAKELRETDEKSIIIFITAIPDFIQDGYDVSALHYLMKPVNEDKLFAVLDRAVKQLAKTERTLFLPVDGEMMRISEADIMYIESFAHHQEIWLKSGCVSVKMPAYKLEQQLGSGFIRCHRSYIVNKKYISKITKTDIVLDNGKEIPLSRRLYNEVSRAMLSYVKERHGRSYD